MERFNKFLFNLQQSIIVFVFLILLINLYRIIFLSVFADKLSVVTLYDIFSCLWLGFRLSLKTAGLLALIGFVFSALPQLIWLKWPAKLVNNIFSYIAILLLTLGVSARIPYYEIYNSTFNVTLLNALHDDIWAIYNTAVTEYQLYPSLCVALLTTYVLCISLNRFLAISTYELQVGDRIDAVKVGAFLVAFLPVFCLLVRFGGGYSYATGIHWENARRLNSHILNEAILDDGQAMYRVWFAYKRLDKANKIEFTLSDIRQSVAYLGGDASAITIDESLMRTVNRQMLLKQPQNVIFILGENYAVWPFLDEYRDLGLVNEGKRLIESGKAAYTLNFLSQGSETVMATNALLTGLNNLFLHENYQPISYKEKYHGGIGTIMQDLGYKTYFWYGGFSGWQDIDKFTKAQGFDYFISAGDYPYSEGNVWGVADEYLFKAVENHIINNVNEKAFHFILTMTNHPPFTLDVESKGFDKQKVKRLLPSSITSNDRTISHLGHIWYADKMMGLFINNIEKILPDTLFTVVGDHAERFSFAKNATRQERSGVPCIIYGNGVESYWFRKNQVGAHMQLPGTLAEILGKPGNKYCALMPNMFQNTSNTAVNNYLYIKDGKFGSISGAEKQVRDLATSTKRISAWRVLKGNEIE